MTNRNAVAGRNVETLFANSISDNPKVHLFAVIKQKELKTELKDGVS